jgi:hypothetical protein
MELEVKGTIKVIMDLKTFDSGFTKREFVITTQDKYPQDVKFEVTKEKATDFETYNNVGDEVKVKFNLRGNFHEPTNNYFNNLHAWRIEKNNAQTTEKEAVQTETEDDLPF